MKQGLLLDKKEFKRFIKESDYLPSLQSMVNKKLFLQLISIKEQGADENLLEFLKYNERKDLAQEFNAEYSLSYYGEILERFDEKNIQNNDKDLFTLIFATLHIVKYYKFYQIEKQEDIFKNKISSIVNEKTDLSNKLIYLTYLTEHDYSNIDQIKITLENIMENIENSENLLELLSAISLIIYCRDRYEIEVNIPKNIDNIISKFLSGDIDIFKQKEEFLRTICNLYILLGEPKKKEYENRTFVPFLKSMHHLSLKTITDKDIISITDFWNINPSVLYYLNFIATQLNVNTEKDSKVSMGGYGKIATKAFKDAYETSDNIPEYVVDLINKQYMIIDDNSKRKTTKENRINKFLNDILLLVEHPKTLNNFKTLFKIITDASVSHLNFELNQKYLLQKEYFEIIPDCYRMDLCTDILKKECNKDSFNESVQIMKNLNVDFDTIYSDFDIVSNGIRISYINLEDYNEINKNDRLSNNCIKYITYKYSKFNVLKYLVDYLKTTGEKRIGEYTAGNIYDLLYNVLCKFSSDLYKDLCNNLINDNDLNYVKDALTLFLNLCLCWKITAYQKSVYLIYTNENYLNVLQTSHDDLKNIYEALLRGNDLNEEERFGLQSYFLSDKEKEERLISTEIKENITNKIGNGLIYKYQLMDTIKNIKYLDRQEAKNALVAALTKSAKNYGEYVIPAISYLNNLNIIKDEELSLILKNISSTLS